MVALPRTYDPGVRMSPQPHVTTPATPAARPPKGTRGAAPHLGAARQMVVEQRALLAAEQKQRALLEATEHADDLGWLLAHATSVPLLSRDDEVRLARTMRDGPARAAAEARAQLITSNLRLVMRMARSMIGMGTSGGGNGGLALADLTQEGMIGLVRAVDRFDPESGNRFSTYATWWIAQAIHRAAADTGHAIRLPVYLFERRRRLMRLRAQLSAELARAPRAEEIADAYNAAYGLASGHASTKNAVMLDAQDVDELLAIHGPVLSLDQQIAGSSTRTRSSADDDMTLGGMLADPASVEDYQEREQETDARWLLDIARYTLRVGRGAAHQQAMAQREYDIFVIRALHPGVTLADIGQRWGITRERVRQIEVHANEQVRRALVEVGMTAPKPLDDYPQSQEELRRAWRAQHARRRERKAEAQ